MPTSEGPPPGEYPDGHIEAYVESAAARDVTEIGFTEHLYRCVESADALGPFWTLDGDAWYAAGTEGFVAADRNLSLDGYVSAVVTAKDRGLPVKLGLEIDFFPHTIDAVLTLIEPYPWDYLIGSVHWVGAWGIDDSRVFEEFSHRGADRAWADYFAIETELARTEAVDVLGHVDVIKKLGVRSTIDPGDWYTEVVAGASETGVAVEVSSQGLRNPAAEVYPAPRFLQMFHDAGVPITLASDGHRPADAGLGNPEVVAAARAAGYTTHLRFTRREPYAVELPEAVVRS